MGDLRDSLGKAELLLFEEEAKAIAGEKRSRADYGLSFEEVVGIVNVLIALASLYVQWQDSGGKVGEGDDTSQWSPENPKVDRVIERYWADCSKEERLALCASAAKLAAAGAVDSAQKGASDGVSRQGRSTGDEREEQNRV